ncbi:MAG: ATP-binding protein [Bacteroidota bacterium]
MRLTKVLLIDDDEDDYFLTKVVFDQLPTYELSWVSNYNKGITAIRRNQFDVYLVDYRLDNTTGLDLLKEAINSGCKQPIIMLTGKGNSRIDQEAMEIGAADYLIKDQLGVSIVERSIRYAIRQASVLKELQYSEAKYRTIFEEANDPMIITDHTGKIIDMNPAGSRFFGYESNLILNKKSEFLFKSKEEATLFFSSLEEKGALHNFECLMLTKTGTEVSCNLSAFIYTDMKSVSEVFHIMIKDLSYRKSVERESVNLGKMSISEHIARGLGEEVRDPLSTVNLTLDELAAEDCIISSESAQICIEIIKANCDRINQVIKNFISSTETKSLNMQKANVAVIVDHALEAAEDLFAGQDVQLTKQLTPSDVELLLDVAKIKNAIVNVIKNALEAINGFSKEISIVTEINSYAFEITISDNGTGIEPHIQDRIFEPFFSTKLRTVGLGLTHAQRVFVSHGGGIIYKPQRKGSAFVLHLPLDNKGNI